MKRSVPNCRGSIGHGNHRPWELMLGGAGFIPPVALPLLDIDTKFVLLMPLVYALWRVLPLILVPPATALGHGLEEIVRRFFDDRR